MVIHGLSVWSEVIFFICQNLANRNKEKHHFRMEFPMLWTTKENRNIYCSEISILSETSPIDRSFTISGPRPSTSDRKKTPLIGTRHTISSLFCYPSLPRIVAAEMTKCRVGEDFPLLWCHWGPCVDYIVVSIGVGNMTGIRHHWEPGFSRCRTKSVGRGKCRLTLE